MSKSKRNTVDPSDIMESYGADTARWFMLSDSPPDRDVIWTEDGVAGAYRFVQRIWRLVGEAAAEPMVSRARRDRAVADSGRHAARPSQGRASRARRGRRQHQGPSLQCRRRPDLRAGQRHRRRGRAFSGADRADRSLAHAVREALELLVQMMAPMMPHLAEECWAALGHARSGRDPAVAGHRPLAACVEDMITLPVQVNGKKRGELTIAIDASQADVERATLALDAVRRALEGQIPKKIVVVPKRIVNVVV